MDWAERLEQASRERVTPDMPLAGILEITNEFAWIPILLVEGNVKTLQTINERKTHPFLSQTQGN